MGILTTLQLMRDRYQRYAFLQSGIGIGIELKSKKVAGVLMTALSQTAHTASKEPIYDSRSKVSQE